MASPNAPGPAKPAKPPTLLPNHSYIHITSPHDPQAAQAIPGSSKLPEGLTLEYIGPVGELSGEYIYEVKKAGGGFVPRGELPVGRGGVLEALRGVTGVKGVEVMDVRQRAKRDEF